MYRETRGLLACKAMDGASGRYIGRIIRRSVVTIGVGYDVPSDTVEFSNEVCIVVGCAVVG
jgi:hypothetical protein